MTTNRVGLSIDWREFFMSGFHVMLWFRHFADPHRIAHYAMGSQLGAAHPLSWEQGLVATLYAPSNTHQLPYQRYFYPIHEGLPRGLLGYDYAGNPCRFASLHFGGSIEKPGDAVALRLAPQILGRKPEQRICPYRRETEPIQEAR